MAGAFSGHLLESYDKQRSTPGPGFGQHRYSSIVTSGAMSFDASMHGSSGFRPNNPVSDHSFSTDLTDDTAIKIATLQAKLNKKLGPEYISQRPGPGGGPKLTYAEGWKIINLANEVFGFNGWSSSIVNMTIDYMDCSEEGKRYNVGVSCIVRVTLRCGVYHEDVGYGAAENVKSKAQAIDKSKKESVTDAVKRALRNFGTLLGNCLYDKSYTQEITKIKVPPAKFDKSELYRRPEFDDTKPNIASTSESTPASVPTAPRTPTIAQGVKMSPVLVKCEAVQEAETPITYIPRHLRQAMTAGIAGSTTTTPSHNEQAPRNAHSSINGLSTPILTSVQQTVNPNRGQYRRTELSPLAQPEQRQVSSTELAAAQVDEVEIPEVDETSYSIDSDDDAFYANVDLGDGDLGRPIDFEEGLGGVSVSDVSLDRGEAATSGNLREPLKAPRGNSVHGLASSSSGRGEATASGGSRFPLAHPPRPQAQAGPSTTSRVLHGVDSAAGASVAPPMKHELGSGSSVSISSSSEARRAAPSIGGFHFPPVMQPKPVLPPQRSTGVTSTSSNSSGLKRKVDTMQASSSSSSRQPLQGLGLAQQHPGSGNPNRAPLTSLDIGTGSGVKRTKR